MTPISDNLARGVNQLARSQPQMSLIDAAGVVAAFAGCARAFFVRPDGQRFAPDATLREAVQAGAQLELRLDLADHNGDGQPWASRFHAQGDAIPTGEAPLLAFVREFARLQTRNEFMWAGYVVRELLPRVGYPPHDTKSVLNDLREQKIVNVKRVHNPRNPDFPATAVQLNLEHPRVAEILGQSFIEELAESAEHRAAVGGGDLLESRHGEHAAPME